MSRLTLTAPNHEKPQNKKGSYFRNYLIQRAENGTQTRDPQLGRLVLYQLSYFRVLVGKDGFEPPKAYASRFTVCPIWPLWNLPL